MMIRAQIQSGYRLDGGVLIHEALRSLYCCSDGVRGRGAPVTYLSHTASFHSNEGIAPSNRGIKHLTTMQTTVLALWLTSQLRPSPARCPHQMQNENLLARILLGVRNERKVVRRSKFFLAVKKTIQSCVNFTPLIT